MKLLNVLSKIFVIGTISYIIFVILFNIVYYFCYYICNIDVNDGLHYTLLKILLSIVGLISICISSFIIYKIKLFDDK